MYYMFGRNCVAGICPRCQAVGHMFVVRGLELTGQDVITCRTNISRIRLNEANDSLRGR